MSIFEESGRAHILEDRLRKDIETIRGKVLEIGGLVELAVGRSLRSLLKKDHRLAYSIILRDQHIDRLEKEIDRLCLEFLVRQQPAAGHLRFVHAATQISGELERVGDYAESIARQVLFIEIEGEIPCYALFEEIGKLSIKMLRDSLRAFVDQDADLARSTMLLESQTDNIRSRIRRQLLEFHRDGLAPVEMITPLLITASRFERVADQSVNLCEEVLFMCTGEIVKHPDGGAFRVLFLSEHNSTRSQMAEGIARSLGVPYFSFASAGVTPHVMDTRAVRFMAEKGIDISSFNSKSLQQITDLDHYQVIILLSKEAEEAAGPLPAKAIELQWLTPDPSKVTGSDEEVREAYEKTYSYLTTHIRDFVEAVLNDGDQSR